MTQTNEITHLILNDLYNRKIFAWRQNTVGIPTPTGFRPTTKTGISDIIAILPPVGKFIAIEIKIGKDRLRPEQEGFLANVRAMGGHTMIVHSFQDYVDNISKINLTK